MKVTNSPSKTSGLFLFPAPKSAQSKTTVEKLPEKEIKADPDDRDQIEALRELADHPGTRSYRLFLGKSVPEVKGPDANSFEVEVPGHVKQLQRIPEWDYVDSTKKETFQAQSGCYGCTADLIDRVLDDEGIDDVRTQTIVENIVAQENDRKLPVDERLHDVLMLVGGCVSTFLPEPTEKTKDVGASILNLAVDISEAKFL
ncbi:hypothetical protein ACHAWO_004250 [Cyclotella atomus]|jgi:hypothetical protein|uniref:Uncharacterized protein n=1 Tax=Cyclotella atomus TaxID=382360 RepID=A0ABD3NLW9_9STRA